MACSHASIKQQRPGQRDNCIECKAEIIFTSEGKWVWYYSISTKERRALEIVFNVDQHLADRARHG